MPCLQSQASFRLHNVWSVRWIMAGGSQAGRYVVFSIKKKPNKWKSEDGKQSYRAERCYLHGLPCIDVSGVMAARDTLDVWKISGRQGTFQELVRWYRDRLSCASGRTKPELWGSVGYQGKFAFISMRVSCTVSRRSEWLLRRVHHPLL